MRYELRYGGPADGLTWDDSQVQPVEIVRVEMNTRNSFPAVFHVRAGSFVEMLDGSPAAVPFTRYLYETTDTATATAIFRFTPDQRVPV